MPQWMPGWITSKEVNRKKYQLDKQQEACCKKMFKSSKNQSNEQVIIIQNIIQNIEKCPEFGEHSI